MHENPAAFILFALIIGSFVWWLATLRIAVLNDRISGLKERNAFLESSVRQDIPKASTREPISSDQFSQIVRNLMQCGSSYTSDDGKKKERIVCVQIPVNSNENEALAFRLKNAIESAGWKADFGLITPEERYQKGICILGPASSPGGQPTTRKALKGALASAGIESEDRDEVERGFAYNQPELAFMILGKLGS